MASSQIQSDSEVIKSLVAEITKGETTDIRKFALIQNWMDENIDYDYDAYFRMADGVTGWVETSAIRTFDRKKGICSETSMLTVASMRAANIPTRSIYGKARGGYHQWTEAYIHGAWFEYEPMLPAYAQKGWANYERLRIDWRL